MPQGLLLVRRLDANPAGTSEIAPTPRQYAAAKGGDSDAAEILVDSLAKRGRVNELHGSASGTSVREPEISHGGVCKEGGRTPAIPVSLTRIVLI
jgi:hypothetical protein